MELHLPPRFYLRLGKGAARQERELAVDFLQRRLRVRPHFPRTRLGILPQPYERLRRRRPRRPAHDRLAHPEEQRLRWHYVPGQQRVEDVERIRDAGHATAPLRGPPCLWR